MLVHRRSLLGSLLAAPLLRAAPSLRAGAATANISPPLGTSLAGFMTDRKTTEVHDELVVRCAALESAGKRMLLATIDSCMVPRVVLDPVRAAISRQNAVAPECILISSTHTHSAPPAMHLFQSPTDEAYVKLLQSRLADAASMAFRRLRPARLGAAVGSEPSLVFHRRYFMRDGSVPPDPFGARNDRVLMNPPAQSPDIVRAAGPVDPQHGVIAALGDDGRMIWIYGNYALHYAGFNPPTDTSADYFGAWARRMEAEAGRECVALLSNGCAGNINGIDFSRPAPKTRDYSIIERTAGVLALETLRLLRDMEYRNDVPLGGAWQEVELAVRKPSRAEVDAAVRIVGSSPANEYKERPMIYARETMFLDRFPERVRVPVQGLRIGDTGIGAFPGETFVEWGLQVKRESKYQRTLTVSIANDACGYIPTVEAFDVGGYETWRAKSSYLEREAGSKIAAGVGRVLESARLRE
jgi:hypothetical protein